MAALEGSLYSTKASLDGSLYGTKASLDGSLYSTKASLDGSLYSTKASLDGSLDGVVESCVLGCGAGALGIEPPDAENGSCTVLYLWL